MGIKKAQHLRPLGDQRRLSGTIWVTIRAGVSRAAVLPGADHSPLAGGVIHKTAQHCVGGAGVYPAPPAEKRRLGLRQLGVVSSQRDIVDAKLEITNPV